MWRWVDASARRSVTDALRPSLQNIAFDYFLSIGKNLLVTSGLRTPAEQASAMLVKIEDTGGLNDYRNRTAAAAIMGKYTAGKTAGETDAQIVARMTDVITAQVAAGPFVSKHLNNLAFDVRLSDTDDTALHTLEIDSRSRASND